MPPATTRPTRLLTPTLLLALLLGGSSPARADGGPKLPLKAFFLHPGLTLGGATTLGSGTGFVLGGEVSGGLWIQPFYIGGVVEGLYDWHREGARVMVGVVAGFGLCGVDGGYLMERAGGQTFHGGAVRLFVTIGIMGLYVRYGALREAPDFVDFGLFIKVPLRFRAEYHDWRRRLRADPALPPASGPVEPR